MHRPLPFRFIHKMHHTVHTPYACAAFYLHPIELTILDNGAAFVAAKLFPSMRFWTSTLLALVLPVRAVHEHLGYSFPWDADERVGTGKATHHAIHHMPKARRRCPTLACGRASAWSRVLTPFVPFCVRRATSTTTRRLTSHSATTCSARATRATTSCASCAPSRRERIGWFRTALVFRHCRHRQTRG